MTEPSIPLPGWLTRILEKVGLQNAVVLALLAAPSMMLVNVQYDMTNGSASRSAYWAATLTKDYMAGTIGDNWRDDVPTVVVKARILVRLLIEAGRVLSLDRLSVNAINTGIQFCCIWAVLFILYKSSLLLGMTAGWGIVSALLVPAFVPWGFMICGWGTSFPYDFPSLFFCAAGMAAILDRKYYWLLAVIAIGTVNKETTIFLIPGYLLAEWPDSSGRRRALLARVALLSVAFGVAYEVPRLLLQSGHPLLLTMSDHVIYLHEPRWYLNLRTLLLRDGANTAENVYWPLLLHVPALLGFRSLPWRMKAIYLATPLFIGPIFLLGNLIELRLLNELIPLGAWDPSLSSLGSWRIAKVLRSPVPVPGQLQRQ